jgi:hypothetical protein
VWVPFSASQLTEGTYARRRFTPRTGRHLTEQEVGEQQVTTLGQDGKGVGQRRWILEAEGLAAHRQQCPGSPFHEDLLVDQM